MLSVSEMRRRFRNTDRMISCQGKRRYPTYTVAMRRAATVADKLGVPILPYKCRYCPLYHIGHTPDVKHLY